MADAIPDTFSFVLGDGVISASLDLISPANLNPETGKVGKNGGRMAMKFKCSGCGRTFNNLERANLHLSMNANSKHSHHTNEHGWKRARRLHLKAYIIMEGKR